MRIHFISLFIFCSIFFSGCQTDRIKLSPSSNDLVFNDLASTWDEAMPLGNGMIGALVWQKDNNLRLSLDRVDLWDTRPLATLDKMPVNNFKWVEQQVLKKDYAPVQQMYDVPYDTSAYPSKIPGGALEFEIASLGKVDSVRLMLNNALCEVKWTNGARMQSYVHAEEPQGWFRFENVGEDFIPVLVTPLYQTPSGRETNSLDGHDLRRLGYPQGQVVEQGNTLVYHQKGSNGFYYDIAVAYQRKGNVLEGVWSISSKRSDEAKNASAPEVVKTAIKKGFDANFENHNTWWTNYWKKSSVSIPDKVLAKQYYNEMYKFGSAARSYAPPISLQAVWTADNGQLPPWKGDFHHDLNTQLSYWPCYAGNRLDEGSGYLNWLWEVKDICKTYTKNFFGVEGLAVPGVSTIDGEPMAGWIQYSLSPTVSSWLSHHFYLHWKYSQDKEYLKNRAYPYIKDVAVFLDKIAVRDNQNMRKLPLSASPEIYDNSIRAWFYTNTNYDLGLIRFLYTAAVEMANELGLKEEATKWQTILNEWPYYDLDEQGALTFAKGFPYNESHRHFSNIMAFHPLGLVDWGNGEKDQKVIKATIKKLEEYGPDYWCGYSYSWLGNVKARAMDGEGAAKALKIFAEHFCLRNTFHANGDQTKMGYSTFTYRPFTLEGNFAFASGIHEMIIQSHTGIIRLFPAIPESWADVSFEKMRAVGAFIVSAEKKDGKVSKVVVVSEKGGTLQLANPFDGDYKTDNKNILEKEGILTLVMDPGEELILNY